MDYQPFWQERIMRIMTNGNRALKIPRKLKKAYKARIIKAANLNVRTRGLHIYSITTIEGQAKKLFGYAATA